MSTARIVLPTIALGAGGVAPSLASGSAELAETLARARPTGTTALALRGMADAYAVKNISEDQASKRSEGVDGVRYRIAIPTTAQK
jgi:hypothetical protein